MYELLETVMQPWLAALTTAGVAILFSVLVLVIAQIVLRVAVPKAPLSHKAPLNATEFGALLGKEARAFVESNSWATLGLVAALGFLLAFSPRLRKIVWKLL
jgi:hypothetical protein